MPDLWRTKREIQNYRRLTLRKGKVRLSAPLEMVLIQIFWVLKHAGNGYFCLCRRVLGCYPAGYGYRGCGSKIDILRF